MKKLIKRLFNGTRGAISITGIVVDIALISALIPIISLFVSQGFHQYTCNDALYPYSLNTTLCMNTTAWINDTLTGYAGYVRVGLSTTETTLLGLTTLFIVLGLIFAIVKQSGLIKKK